MSTQRTAAMALVLSMIGGCSSQPPGSGRGLPPELRTSTVVSSYNPRVTFPGSGTFSFLPQRGLKADKDSRFDLAELDRLLRSAMRRAMERKGYRYGTPAASDLLVAYLVVLESHLDDTAISSRYGFKADWASGGVLPETYEKGMLVVDIFDGQTMRPVWRGALQANVDPNVSEAIRRQRVTDAAVRILSAFSP